MGYYLSNILILGCFYSILAISLNMAGGYAGVLSLSHAAFYGIGAYSVALLTVKTGVPFWPALMFGAFLAALSGCLVGIPTLRLKGDYLLIATLGFGEIFKNTLVNADTITEGPRGITAIPSPEVFSLPIKSDHNYLLLLLFVLLLCACSGFFIKKSPFGQVLFAIAEDEDGVAALGRNPSVFKLTIIGVSTFWAGVAGGLYAGWSGYINPSQFSINESIMILSMVLLGGLRSTGGAIIGAFSLVSLPEILRFVGFPDGDSALLRQMFYGALLVAVMYIRPRGLMGTVKLG